MTLLFLLTSCEQPSGLSGSLCSEEVPEALRRWPAWRARLAPGIVQALLADPDPAGHSPPGSAARPAADAPTASAAPASGRRGAAELARSVGCTGSHAAPAALARAAAGRAAGPARPRVPERRVPPAARKAALPRATARPGTRGKENDEAVGDIGSDKAGCVGARRRAVPKRFVGYVLE